MQLDCPVAPCAEPGEQEVQFIDPEVVEYDPAAHAVHCAESFVEEKKPSAHEVHACEFAELDFPAAQSPQS
jgi:phage baseplate assembly protein gpV